MYIYMHVYIYIYIYVHGVHAQKQACLSVCLCDSVRYILVHVLCQMSKTE